ncbi:Integrase, catalytic core [Corchorus capsularis]|uniref:Integrase, catalytic core n=1 Tax=Corchorus capsularis TaxID=210143 RepID=A0A1R3G9U8_COCAP|nr:Integrase, catalytic core [Corchorus capsularis]
MLMNPFQELDHRDKVVMKDPDDVEAYRKSIERLRVHIFLAGLDNVYEHIRGEILMKKSIPTLEDCYALIRREAVRRVMLKIEHENLEAAVMVTRNKAKATTGGEKSTYKCSHCSQTGHTKDRYYELVGYPDWWDHNRASKKKNSKKTPTATVAETKADDDVVEMSSGLAATIDKGGGSRWFVTFIDDCTRMTWLWLMKSKSDVNLLFQKFHKIIQTQYNEQIRVLRSDNGGEYLNSELTHYLETQGMINQTTCVDTPRQNGVAERKNRHLLEVVRALLIQAHMPLAYWGEALSSAAYLINRTPSRSIEFQTPFQAFTKAVAAPPIPNLPHRVFGCVAFVHIHKHQCNKLAPRALRCVFLGYATSQKGYRCYHPPTKRMFITMDVVFHEDTMYFSESDFQGQNEKEIHTLDYDIQGECKGDYQFLDGNVVNDIIGDNVVGSSGNGVDDQEEHESRIESEEIGDVVPSVTEDETLIDIPHQLSAEDVPIPALELPRKQLLERLTRGIPKPTYEPEISSRVKYPMSHYVSNNNLSESNKSFVNQLSGVAIPNRVQEALDDPKWKAAMNEEMNSLQKNQTWEIVECPPGKKPVGCRWVYTVKHKADGTVERFKARLVAKGYTQTYGIDYTETFAPVAKINNVRVLLSLAANMDWPLRQFDVKNAFLHGELSEEIYIELPPGNDPDERKALQEYLSREFEMKDLGCLKYFLGIEVSRSKKGIFLSQRKYALDLLHETGMSACQPADTPVEEGLKLCVEADQVPVDKGRYQRLVGRLMYLAHTRPDLAYALSIVSQFMHNPSEQHMKAIMRILRYVKSAPGKGILFTKNEDWQGINVYMDADWAGSLDDRRTTSGYFTFVGGNLVTWRSKKQNVVAHSNAKAEFRGIALGLCEALWPRLLLQDLGYPPRQPIRLYCDNKAACDIAHNPVQHDRTKHVEVDRFFIKEKLDEGIVDLPKIWSEDQLADILTKAVSGHVFSKFLGKLGMHDIYGPTWRGLLRYYKRFSP